MLPVGLDRFVCGDCGYEPSCMEAKTQPGWAVWQAEAAPFTLGVEEEVMLLDPRDWSLDQRFGELRERLSPGLAGRLTSETHGAAIEFETEPRRSVGEAAAELEVLRALLKEELAAHGRAVAAIGTHPFTTWQETELSPDRRYRYVYESMRELARREPTFATHVHVAVDDPELAIATANRMRVHLPLLLALSANSPFWLGRDSGLASARTPVFWGFPRTGIPRAFTDYEDYVSAIDTLISCGAFPDPTYLWWDQRLRPGYGTIEIRIMDTQAELWRTAALAALTQSLVRMEALDDVAPAELYEAPELLEENGFRAARDGVRAELLDPRRGCAHGVPALAELAVEACRSHARELGCELELDAVARLIDEPADELQRAIAGPGGDLKRVVAELSGRFSR
jgi:carboxylate-amine ligase